MRKKLSAILRIPPESCANGIIIPEKKKERNIRGIAIALAVAVAATSATAYGAVFLARSPIIIANKQNGIEYK